MSYLSLKSNRFTHKIKFMQLIKTYIIITFAIIEKGTLPMKLGASLMFVVCASPLIWFSRILREYVLMDIGFIEVLVLSIAIDLFAGVWKHLKQHTFCWKRLYTGLIEKVGISFIGMIVFNLITDLKEWHHMETVKDYIILVGKLTNLFYVIGSAFNSMYVITGGKFPPLGWMKRMKQFNNTLDTRAIVDVRVDDETSKITSRLRINRKK